MRAYLRFLLVLCAAAVGGAEDAYEAAERLGLLPTPRHLSLSGEQQSLDGWEIVVAHGASLSRVGAEEINRRLEELHAAPLPVSASPTPGRPFLLVGPATDGVVKRMAARMNARVTPEDPGEQGYVVRFGRSEGRAVVLVAGSDDLGALYGCVTLCRMIVPVDGKVALLTGEVRDRPDYKIRCNFRFNADAVRRARSVEQAERMARDLRREVDFAVRHKINYVFCRLWQRYTENELGRRKRELVTGLLRYARSRGVRTRFIGKVEIRRYLTAEQKQAAVERRKGTAYMWSALEAHRRHAEDYAAFLKEAQGGVFALHPVDSGGYVDPETWSQRSPACRARYGGDRARASVEQYRLYFDAARRAVPDIELEAVSYPYHYQFAVPEFPATYLKMAEGMPSSGWVRGIENEEHARKIQQALVAYHRHLSEHLDKDVTITFREASRRIFLACASIYEGHPITIWIYPDRNRGWLGTFCPQVRMAKTFWRPAARDHYFVASSWRYGGDPRVQRLAQQEYLWGIDRPDASDAFTAGSRRYESEGRSVTPWQRKHLIPRVCRVLYGEASPAFEPFIAANVSFRYAADPEYVASERGERFEEVHRYAEEQAAAFREHHKRFEEWLGRLETLADLPAGTDSWLLHHYKYSGIAATKSRLDAIVSRARRFVTESRFEETRGLVTKTRNGLAEMQKRVEAIHARVDEDPRNTMDRKTWKQHPDHLLHKFRPSDYRALLQDVLDQTESAVSLGTLPAHVAAQLKGRRIEVCRFQRKYPFKADGARGEGGWTNAQTVDFFTVGERTLARFETVTRLTWDDDALYVFCEAYDPAPKDRPRREGTLFSDESLELFVAPEGRDKPYYHFAVSVSKERYESRCVPGRRPERRWTAPYEVGIRRSARRWSAEWRIPFASLGRRPAPGDAWHVNLARNRPGGQGRTGEQSNVILSDRNHRPDLFLPLVFSGQARVRVPNEVRASLEGVRRKDQTTEYGFSTFLAFKLKLETDRSLVYQTLLLEVVEPSGKVVATERREIARIPGRWSMTRPVELDLGRAFKTDLTLRVSFLGPTRKDRPPSRRPIASFVIDPEGRAEARP